MRGSTGADWILPRLIVGPIMENCILNKTICEELFGGELDVTEETPDPFETDKSQVR